MPTSKQIQFVDTLTLGDRLKLFRALDGHSQVELAARLGLNQGSLARIEMGVYQPTPESLARLCRYFALHPPWLESGTLPVFSLPVVFFCPTRAGSLRLQGMVGRVLAALMTPFLRESGVKTGWMLPGVYLYVFPVQSSFLILSAPAFAMTLERALSELAIYPTRLPIACASPLSSWHDLAKLLPELLPHLGVTQRRLPEFTIALQSHALHRFATTEESPMDRVLEQIRELINRSGVDPIQTLQLLIEEYGRGSSATSSSRDTAAQTPRKRLLPV